MQILKADTEVKVRIGPFVDVGDGFTPQTDITLGGNEAELLKHNGVATVDISGNTWAAVTSCRGWYDLTLTTTDTNTEGLLTVVVQDDSDCLPVFAHFMVVNANVYDSLYGTAAADYLQVDALQLGGATQSATDLKDFADAGYDPATNKVQGVVLVDTTTTNTDMVAAAPTAAANADAVWDEAASGHVAAGSFGTQCGTDIDAILVDTAVIGALGAGLTAIPWNSAWDTEVESEVTDSLVAHNLDHLCLTVTAAADMTTEVADNTILSRILANGDTSAFVPSTDGLQLIRDKLTDIETDTGEIGTAGASLTDLGGMSTTMKGEVNAEVDTALNTAIPGSPTADSVNQRVVAIDDLTQASGAGDLVAILTDTGTTLDTKLTTIDDFVDTEVAAIKAKTDNLPSGIAKNVALSNFTFLMVLSSDHVSPATGKTVTEEISKDGGAFAACTNTFAEIANGLYKINLTQTEMNADTITLKLTATGADQRTITIFTS